MDKLEERQCIVFADQLVGSRDFLTWVLGYTKFGQVVDELELLWEKQMENHQGRWWQYWHNPSCDCDGCVGGRETDIFAVFHVPSMSANIALHFENKHGRSVFKDRQAERYRKRAACWMHKERFLNYGDFETVLLAPLSFQERYKSECTLFDDIIPHEDLLTVLPDFPVL